MIDKYISRLKIIGEHEIAKVLQKLHDERNAAVEDLHGYCHVCVYYDNPKVCDNCIHTATIFNAGGNADNWEWRGLTDGEQKQGRGDTHAQEHDNG